jgi:hypothetical protein
MMMATMYGDEVANEYTTGADQAALTIEQIEASGKKLSNKEKKKLLKAAEQKQRGLEYDEALMKASAEGAQFACSQSIVDPNDLQWQNSLDVHIPSLSISAHNKELFVDTEFHIAHGRRYGLVGPNGKDIVTHSCIPYLCSHDNMNTFVLLRRWKVYTPQNDFFW